MDNKAAFRYILNNITGFKNYPLKKFAPQLSKRSYATGVHKHHHATEVYQKKG